MSWLDSRVPCVVWPPAARCQADRAARRRGRRDVCAGGRSSAKAARSRGRAADRGCSRNTRSSAVYAGPASGSGSQVRRAKSVGGGRLRRCPPRHAGAAGRRRRLRALSTRRRRRAGVGRAAVGGGHKTRGAEVGRVLASQLLAPSRRPRPSRHGALDLAVEDADVLHDSNRIAVRLLPPRPGQGCARGGSSRPVRPSSHNGSGRPTARSRRSSPGRAARVRNGWLRGHAVDLRR